MVAEVCKHTQPGNAARVNVWEPASKLPAIGDTSISEQQNEGHATGSVPTTLGTERSVDGPPDSNAAPKAKPGVKAYETAAMTGLKAKSEAAAKRKALEGRGRGSTLAAGKGGARGRGSSGSVVKAASRGRGAKAIAAAGVGAKPLKVDLSEILVNKLAKSLSRNAFGCRGDAAATKACKASGASDAVHKATKRACWQACGNLWD
jgi:hypothetical protein